MVTLQQVSVFPMVDSTPLQGYSLRLLVGARNLGKSQALPISRFPYTYILKFNAVSILIIPLSCFVAVTCSLRFKSKTSMFPFPSSLLHRSNFCSSRTPQPSQHTIFFPAVRTPLFSLTGSTSLPLFGKSQLPVSLLVSFGAILK